MKEKFKSLKKLDKKRILQYDVIIIVDHDIINFKTIYDYSKFIFDTRGYIQVKIQKSSSLLDEINFNNSS